MNTQGKNWSQKIVKASILIAGATMTMGNQKCEQKVEGPRTLKKIVELGAIQASPLMFSSSSGFDFKFVANQQIYEVMMNSGEYTMKYNPTISAPPGSVSDTKLFNLTNADGKMMSKMLGKTSSYGSVFSNTAWCMVDLPQVVISGAVNSFEITGGGGLTIGYNPTGSLLPASGSAGIEMQSAQLDVSMRATRPLIGTAQTSRLLASAGVNAKQTKTSLKATINFGLFSVGPSAFFQSPLSKVTKEALTKAVDALSANPEMKADKWYSRVIVNMDTHVMVVGGTNANIKVGDQFLIYNDQYRWSGEPCYSEFLGTLGSAANKAVAKIEIDTVGDEISRGRIIEQNDMNPEVGARVQLFKLRPADYVEPEPGVEQVLPPVNENPNS